MTIHWSDRWKSDSKSFAALAIWWAWRIRIVISGGTDRPLWLTDPTIPEEEGDVKEDEAVICSQSFRKFSDSVARLFNAFFTSTGWDSSEGNKFNKSWTANWIKREQWALLLPWRSPLAI